MKIVGCPNKNVWFPKQFPIKKFKDTLIIIGYQFLIIFFETIQFWTLLIMIFWGSHHKSLFPRKTLLQPPKVIFSLKPKYSLIHFSLSHWLNHSTITLFNMFGWVLSIVDTCGAFYLGFALLIFEFWRVSFYLNIHITRDTNHIL